MILFTQIQEDLKKAMLERDQHKVDIIRFLVSEIKREAVDSGSDRENISDETVVKVLEKAQKTRKEASKLYATQNRPDLVQQEESEMNVIQKYLPEQLSDNDLSLIIQKVIEENPSIKGMALMGKVIPLVKGKADAERVKSLLLK